MKRKPYRVKKRKSLLKNRFFWYGFSFLAIMAIIFYFIVFCPFFQIRRIEISGNIKISSEEIKKITEEKINKRCLLFPSKSIFLLNLKELNQELLKEFAEISKISITKKLPHTLLLDIEKRNPAAVFCKEQDCFILDKTGIAFEKTNSSELLLVKTENTSVSLGQEIVKEKYIQDILEIQKKLRQEAEIEIAECEILPEKPRLNIKTKQGWEIYFNTENNISEQLTNLFLLLEEKIPLEKRNVLEYIDLRFGSRLYYK